MADTISVDELKIFVGTGLRIYDAHRTHPVMLHGLSFEYFTVDCDNVEWPVDRHIGGTFKPMVRPLSSIPVEDMISTKLYTPDSKTTPAEIKRMQSVFSNSNIIARFTLTNILLLAEKHYDIFNWLNRTGEDGKPLAIELTNPQ